MFYSKALLNATYKNGMPGKLTEAHEKAEHHRFKSQFLFKNPVISKNLYIARLIQHFLIIKAIETQLNKLSSVEKSEISAFFALNYIDQLWRTPAIQNDLKQLGVNTDEIADNEIAKTTKTYIKNIEQLPPKALLAHFLYHVAGFMHGGNIIRSKYIELSNRLTAHQISTEQYNFTAVAALLPGERRSSIAVYQNLMEQLDTIKLDSNEYQDILDQGKNVYETMSSIYDDLCDMYTNQGSKLTLILSVITVSLIAVTFVLKFLPQYSNAMNDTPGQ